MRFYLDTNIKFQKGYNYGKEENDKSNRYSRSFES